MFTVTQEKPKANTKRLSWAKLIVDEIEVSSPMGVVSYPAIYDASPEKFIANVERIADNREQTGKHIAKIKNSVTTLGSNLRDVVVVRYNNKLYTADGEHLKLALNDLSVPVRFKLQTVYNAKEVVNVMRMMNCSSKNWTFMDFVRACKTINSDYAKLYDYIHDKDIDVTPKMLAGIMYSNKKFVPQTAYQMVKDGTFQVSISNAEINKRLETIKRFYRKTNFKKAQHCVWGFMKFMLEKEDDYAKKETKFLELVKNKVQERKYTTFGSDGEYYRFFNEMWNKL